MFLLLHGQIQRESSSCIPENRPGKWWPEVRRTHTPTHFIISVSRSCLDMFFLKTQVSDRAWEKSLGVSRETIIFLGHHHLLCFSLQIEPLLRLTSDHEGTCLFCEKWTLFSDIKGKLSYFPCLFEDHFLPHDLLRDNRFSDMIRLSLIISCRFP